MYTQRILNIVVFILASLMTMVPLRTATADTLTLARVIELGVGNHPGVRAADGELRSARGAYWEAISPSAPIFRIENEEIPRGGSLSEYSLQTVGISQSFDFPLVTYYRARASREETHGARLAHRNALAEARAEITMAYVDAWLAQPRVVIADSLAATASALADAAEKRYAVAEATVIERDRLRAQAAQFVRQRELAALDRDLARARVRRMIGAPAGTDVELTDPGLPNPTMPDSVAAANGAFIGQAQSMLKAAKARHSTAKLSFLPQLEFELFRQRDQERRYWGAAIGLSVPLWHLLGGRGTILQASGATRRAAAEVEDVRWRWNLEWLEATQAYEIARKRLHSLEDIGLPASRRAYGAAVRAYEVGELGVTDLLATFLETRAAELEYLAAQKDAWHWRTQLDILAAPSGRSND